MKIKGTDRSKQQEAGSRQNGMQVFVKFIGS